jgi:hypothetical protein
MKKRIIKLIALVLIVFAPLGIFALYADTLPDAYEKTYLGAFDEKYTRLYSAEGKKIIFIGGSSLPFGLRSDLLESELGGEYEVINFGLYATLGTKFMMDMARDAISEGDIVVLCPETAEQTYSLYFNPDASLQALGGLSTLYTKLSLGDCVALAHNYFEYSFDRIGYAINDNAPDPIGIYRADSLNGFGDISVDRPYNIMNNGYDANMEIYTDDRLLDEEFISYVNEYISDAEKRGATVYFNYSPINCLAIRSSSLTRAEFERSLENSLDCELLGTIEDYLIDERYFYDTNFHLNSAGAIYFSNMLALSLKGVLGMEQTTTLEIPAPPPLEEDVTVEVEQSGEKVDFDKYTGEPNVDYVDVFEYKQSGATYRIVGVKEEYKAIKEVILPSVYNGKNVTAIDANAFYGCAELERIHIGTTYKSLSERAFGGCISLMGVYLYAMDGNRIIPPTETLLSGANEGVKIYIPEGSNYMTGYTWSNYADRFETFVVGGAK